MPGDSDGDGDGRPVDEEVQEEPTGIVLAINEPGRCSKPNSNGTTANQEIIAYERRYPNKPDSSQEDVDSPLRYPGEESRTQHKLQR